MSTAGRRFERLTGRVVDLPVNDVDTDQIIPAAFLKVTGREGLARGLFSDWRRDPDFVLNRPQSINARILLAGHNFGCGSSREHAAWALLDWGFRAVLSSGFSDIFRSNALKNGLVAAELEPADAGAIRELLVTEPSTEITLDLEATHVALPGGEELPFRIDAFARHCLLRGIDQLGYLLEQLPAIQLFEESHRSWVDTSSARTSEEDS